MTRNCCDVTIVPFILYHNTRLPVINNTIQLSPLPLSPPSLRYYFLLLSVTLALINHALFATNDKLVNFTDREIKRSNSNRARMPALKINTVLKQKMNKQINK